jgi:hypothetical protein
MIHQKVPIFSLYEDFFLLIEAEREIIICGTDIKPTTIYSGG